jgi:MinD superfamily P-loop ATPase
MTVKELVVISGKGGTGKTSIVASLAALARKCVLADCDVDAADLHLLLNPEILKETEFIGGLVAETKLDLCTQCGKCAEVCRFGAILGNYAIDPLACEGCGVCVRSCSQGAIRMKDRVSGRWFISDTRFGPMVHAQLGIAEGNSGKLVSLIRSEARRIAEEREYSLIISDGSPGIGCPVIASIAGATAVLVVTEPTVSGIHDLERVAELTSHFKIKTLVCINKADINPLNTKKIKQIAQERKFIVVAEIPYDTIFTRAQMQALSVIEAGEGEAVSNIRTLWKAVKHEIM